MTKAEEFGFEPGDEPYRLIQTGPLIPVKHEGEGATAARMLGEPPVYLMPEDIWIVYDDSAMISKDGTVVAKFDYSRKWDRCLQ